MSVVGLWASVSTHQSAFFAAAGHGMTHDACLD